jgi:hypothetical protein
MSGAVAVRAIQLVVIAIFRQSAVESGRRCEIDRAESAPRLID